MKRIVLLIVVATIVMFVVVLKTPLRTLRSAVFPQDEVASESKPEDKPKAKSADREKPRKTASKISSKSRVAAADASPAAHSGGAVQHQRQTVSIRPSDQKSASAHALAISKDAVPLYAINSTHDSVLKVLRKGTIVEPNLQIIDAYDSWTLVRVPELNVFGFVLSENLARQSTAGNQTPQ